jgi:hypothetical protein
MSTMAVADCGSILCGVGSASSDPIIPVKSHADAEKLSLISTSGTAVASFIQVSYNFDVNYQAAGITLAQAVSNAVWRDLQRGTPLADVVGPAQAKANEYDPFICVAWRVAAGTSGAPGVFGSTFSLKLFKRSWL